VIYIISIKRKKLSVITNKSNFGPSFSANIKRYEFSGCDGVTLLSYCLKLDIKVMYWIRLHIYSQWHALV